MTIDVATLRREAKRSRPGLYPAELTELLDAYEERDRLRAALESIAVIARLENYAVARAVLEGRDD